MSADLCDLALRSAVKRPTPRWQRSTLPSPHISRALSARTALPAALAARFHLRLLLSLNVRGSKRPFLTTGSKEGHLHYLHQVTLSRRTLTFLLEAVTTCLHLRSLHMHYLLSRLLYKDHPLVGGRDLCNLSAHGCFP